MQITTYSIALNVAALVSVAASPLPTAQIIVSLALLLIQNLMFIIRWNNRFSAAGNIITAILLYGCCLAPIIIACLSGLLYIAVLTAIVLVFELIYDTQNFTI